MDTRRLGRSGIELPVIGMGTWQTLDLPPHEQPLAGAVVATALESGTRVFDSSPMYGHAEEVLGRALDGHRDEAFVATKTWSPTQRAAEARFEDQLRFFAGHIELMQIHNLVDWEERLGGWRASGTPGAWACSGPRTTRRARSASSSA